MRLRAGMTFGRMKIVFRPAVSRWLAAAIVWGIVVAGAGLAPAAEAAHDFEFPTAIESYCDGAVPGIGAKLLGRIHQDPFNLVATLIFFGAIAHTFLVSRFRLVSRRYEREHEEIARRAGRGDASVVAGRDRSKFLAVVFHFLGEVEAVFGIWLIPLALAIVLMKGEGAAKAYINGTNFTEPIFVVAVMAIAGSRPVLFFAERCLENVARLGRATPAAWWLAILTAGPLLGSFVTEPAAMTICALLLLSKFFCLQPSTRLRYATLGLLFVNVSVGGTLTHFAAPPVVMVANKWGWGLGFMMAHFGWRAALGIAVSNAVVFAFFRKELLSLQARAEPDSSSSSRIPAWVVAAHLIFIGAVVYISHYSALVVLVFMLFLAFVMATPHSQGEINLKSPVLVGFFLAGLVIHGGCQQWWIEPVLGSMGPRTLLVGSATLTAFNDNAAITYLATLVPGFSFDAKLAVVAGAVAGGGLTVIANAPNPAGQSILGDRFGDAGIDAAKLFLAALFPTAVMLLAFLAR